MMTKQQFNLNKSNTSPVFLLDEDYSRNRVVFINKGGIVSHVDINRIDEIILYYRNTKILISIDVFNSYIRPGNNKWYYKPKSDKYDAMKLYKELQSKIENKECVQYIIPPVTYYKISYVDYQNNYKIDYYELDGEDGHYSEVNDKQKQEKFSHTFNFVILNDEYLETQYENVIEELSCYIDNRNKALK